MGTAFKPKILEDFYENSTKTGKKDTVYHSDFYKIFADKKEKDRY
ncbi:MAG: hypothetical protein Q8Q42_00550 [Nanoarchaeota archaeon]|nr:hypothetical protein [Nanoarchaeota archaeon]